MTGEQYITKAALISDESARVVVFPGTLLLLRDYRAEAKLKRTSLVALYNRRAGLSLTTEPEVEEHLRRAQRQAAERMRAFLVSGLAHPERVQLSEQEDLKPQTSGSTAAVADLFQQNPRTASRTIRTRLFTVESISLHMRAQIRQYYDRVGLIPNTKYVLFWGRKSGEKSGAGPWLDTNEVMLAQMMYTVRQKDPSRRIVLIGDPIQLPLALDGVTIPRPDLDLTLYWDRGFPGGRDTTAQLFFLWLITLLNPDTVAVGTNSGILEIPHLLGLKTVYLENEHLHERKGIRWQMLGANYRFSQDERELPMLRQKVLAAERDKSKRLPELREKVRAAELHKVDVVHGIRPNLQRLSTSTATEFWGMRKWLYGEIKIWLTAPLPKRISAVNMDHDLFLDLVLQSTRADPRLDPPTGNGAPRPSWTTFYALLDRWTTLPNRARGFAGSFAKQAQALRALNQGLQQHALSQHELNRFWETFNYTFTHQTSAAQPPDFRAGYRSWLADTEKIWNKARTRG